MNDFKENNCRLCIKVFCCKRCREKHEAVSHGIFPNCNICVYGKAVLPNPSESLIEHLKSAHWPLRCTLCKRFFGTTSELIKYNKCPMGYQIAEDLESSPYTPGHSYTDAIYESPPFPSPFPENQQPNKNPNMFSKLATSTPMQRGDENSLLEQIQKVITPVEYSEVNKEGIIKKKLDSGDASLKRKVTFCETPMAESNGKEKGMTKTEERGDGISGTPATASAVFYSAKEDLQEDNKETEKTKPTNATWQNIPVIKIEMYDEEVKTHDKEDAQEKGTEESTLWISATNASPGEITPDRRAFDLHPVATPMVAKWKRRRVNIVAPTPVCRKEEINIEFNVEEVPSRYQICRTNLRRSSSLDQLDTNSNSDLRETAANNTLNSAQGRFWSSVGGLLRNVTSVMQSIGRPDEKVALNSNTSFKRCSIDYDLVDGPRVKRYKLTEIKCRRTIRELPAMEVGSWQFYNSENSYIQIKKPILVDKATQTDDIYFPLANGNTGSKMGT